jgi:hypothetical protein
MRLLALTFFGCVLWSQAWTPLFDDKSLAGWKAGFLPEVATASWRSMIAQYSVVLITNGGGPSWVRIFLTDSVQWLD